MPRKKAARDFDALVALAAREDPVALAAWQGARRTAEPWPRLPAGLADVSDTRAIEATTSA